VLSAIDFDDQSSLMFDKIQRVGAKWRLAAKVKAKLL